MWEENLARYDALIAAHPILERKGKTVPYTSVNGHMFTLLNKDGELGFRMSKEDGEAFMEKYNTTRFKSHGAFMRGYVLIPDTLLEDEETLMEYLEQSYAYALSLKPK